jgi:hypothetical protein
MRAQNLPQALVSVAAEPKLYGDFFRLDPCFAHEAIKLPLEEVGRNGRFVQWKLERNDLGLYQSNAGSKVCSQFSSSA